MKIQLQLLCEDLDSSEDDCLIAKVFEDVVIPQLTQMGIELQHPITPKNQLDRLIEGIPTLVTEKGVKLANGIVTPKASGRSQAILANLGHENVCLRRGMTVGHLTSMDKATVTSLTPSPIAVRPKTPPQDLEWNIGPDLTAEQRE